MSRDEKKTVVKHGSRENRLLFVTNSLTGGHIISSV